MKLIETDRDALLRPLQAVTGIVERRHTLPILSNVLLERRPGSLSFMATDLEIQVTTSSTCRDDGDHFEITVSARKLHEILRSLPEASQVTLEATDSRLHVQAGRSRFNLQTLPAQDFPRLAESAESGSELTLPQRALKRLLGLVQYAMAQQDIRYYLNGLFVVVDGTDLTVVATDGHRLAMATLDLDHEVSRQEVILPRKAVVELVKLLVDSEDPVRIDVLGNQVRFDFGSIHLVTKVVDGKFPDYQRVIPKSYSRRFPVDRLLLLQALQRAAILSNEKFRGVRWVLTSNSLRIACTNTEQEEAQEELEIAYEGEPIDIGFNLTYLTDVLSNLSVPAVDCALGDANSSAVITVPGDDRFSYVVMPMRI